MPHTSPENRKSYVKFVKIPTRWIDNDLYGHVNNTVFYSYFDTAINTYLIKFGNLNIHSGDIIGVCAESHCSYLKAVHFPQELEVGIRVNGLSEKSVRYELGLFNFNTSKAAAQGWFVHVFVDRRNMKPVKIPNKIKTALMKLEAPLKANQN